NWPWSTPVVSSAKSELGGGASTLSRDGEGLGVAASAERGVSASVAMAAAAKAWSWRFTRHILSIKREPTCHSAPVPMEVARKPLPEAKPALAGHPVAPGGGHLRDVHPEPVSLHRELQPQLEAASRFDCDLVEQALGVEAEVARGVMHGQPAAPAQCGAGDSRHRPLEQRSDDLAPAEHVARAGDELRDADGMGLRDADLRCI